MTAVRPLSYLNPKLEARISDHSPHEYGVFAKEQIDQGELLTVWGGEIVDFDSFNQYDDYLRELSIQVEDDLFLVPLTLGPADYFNHGCNPNAGLSGQISLIALQNIEPGEEVRFDYAMSESTDYDDFDCDCGDPLCRGRFTGEDWKLPELWERYGEHFSPYLLRRIKKMKEKMNTDLLTQV